MTIYRHGDVLLRRLDEQPAELDGPPAEIVLAEGEVTGHAHRVIGPAAELRDLSTREVPGKLRLCLPQGGRLTHEEHGVIVLPPGVYEIRRQRTLTAEGVWEQVRD